MRDMTEIDGENLCPTCHNKMNNKFIKIKLPLDKDIPFYPRKREEFFVPKNLVDITAPEWSKFLFKNLVSAKEE